MLVCCMMQEVGLFEYVFDWQTGGGDGASNTQAWIDRPGGFKLAWREEEAKEYQA